MDFIKSPNLPEKNVRTILVDYRIYDEIRANLLTCDIEIINTTPCYELYDSICGHPDIQIHHLEDNIIIVAPNVHKYYDDILTKKGFAVIKGDTWLQRNYPGNIAYNVLRIGKYAFHNTKYTDKIIKLQLENLNIELIHVNQGYTKCSVCVLNEKAAITSDYKICKTLEKYGIETLLINPDGIVLEGLNYGFIGGTSGLIAKNTIAFTGEISSIRNNEKILQFLIQKGFTVKLLSNKQIIDSGSIIPLMY